MYTCNVAVVLAGLHEHELDAFYVLVECGCGVVVLYEYRCYVRLQCWQVADV